MNLAGQTYQLWGSQKEVFKFLIIVPRSPESKQRPTWLDLIPISAFLFWSVCEISYQIGTKNEKYKWNPTKIMNEWLVIFSQKKTVCFFPLSRKKTKTKILDFEWMNDQRSFPRKKNGTFAQGDKYFWDPKRWILEGVFEIKKLFLGEDIRPKEIKLGPRRGPPKGWSIPPGDKKN